MKGSLAKKSRKEIAFAHGVRPTKIGATDWVICGMCWKLTPYTSYTHAPAIKANRQQHNIIGSFSCQNLMLLLCSAVFLWIHVDWHFSCCLDMFGYKYQTKWYLWYKCEKLPKPFAWFRSFTRIDKHFLCSFSVLWKHNVVDLCFLCYMTCFVTNTKWIMKMIINVRNFSRIMNLGAVERERRP